MYMLFIILSLLISNCAFSETVKLKNGSVLKGVIVEMNQSDLIIDTAEMGRVTVKRYTIQKITDDDGSDSNTPGTVINVNNSNHVEQKNSQVNTQTMNSGKDKDEGRRWRQGLQGRIHVAQEAISFYPNAQIVNQPKSYTGLNWDLIGFRSESWWALYGEVIAQSNSKDSNEYSLGGALIRLDWNAFKSVNGDTLSLVYFGFGVGSASFDIENTDINGRKTSLELSGTRTTLRAGYDYFWGKYWGFSAFAAINSNSYSSAISKVDGVEVANFELGTVLASSSSFGLGILYNIDL